MDYDVLGVRVHIVRQKVTVGGLTAGGLALVAGFVDAYGYMRWHLFGANMTGNTVIFGISLYGDPRSALFPLVLIGAFVFGSALGRLFAARTSPAIGLTSEAVLLIFAALGDGHLTLCVISLAMGIQNQSIATFSGVHANTSFVTGDYTKIGRAAVDIVTGQNRNDARLQLSVLTPIVGAYALGALFAASCKGVPHEVLLMVPIVFGIAYATHRGMLS